MKVDGPWIRTSKSVAKGCRVRVWFFGPSILILADRSLSYFWTVHFYTFGPSTFILLDRPLTYFWTVHFHTFGPSTFILLDRPVRYFLDRPLFLPGTVHFHTNDRPLWLKRQSTLRTVHFRPDSEFWLFVFLRTKVWESPIWSWFVRILFSGYFGGQRYLVSSFPFQFEHKIWIMTS